LLQGKVVEVCNIERTPYKFIRKVWKEIGKVRTAMCSLFSYKAIFQNNNLAFSISQR
jgi:hypothetical protein